MQPEEPAAPTETRSPADIAAELVATIQALRPKPVPAGLLSPHI